MNTKTAGRCSVITRTTGGSGCFRSYRAVVLRWHNWCCTRTASGALLTVTFTVYDSLGVVCPDLCLAQTSSGRCVHLSLGEFCAGRDVRRGQALRRQLQMGSAYPGPGLLRVVLIGIFRWIVRHPVAQVVPLGSPVRPAVPHPVAVVRPRAAADRLRVRLLRRHRRVASSSGSSSWSVQQRLVQRIIIFRFGFRSGSGSLCSGSSGVFLEWPATVEFGNAPLILRRQLAPRVRPGHRAVGRRADRPPVAPADLRRPVLPGRRADRDRRVPPDLPAANRRPPVRVHSPVPPVTPVVVQPAGRPRGVPAALGLPVRRGSSGGSSSGGSSGGIPSSSTVPPGSSEIVWPSQLGGPLPVHPAAAARVVVRRADRPPENPAVRPVHQGLRAPTAVLPAAYRRALGHRRAIPAPSSSGGAQRLPAAPDCRLQACRDQVAHRAVLPGHPAAVLTADRVPVRRSPASSEPNSN